MVESFPSGMTIALIALSGKPVHQGHYNLIEQASRQNDMAIIFVSTSDRKRKGELLISGADMMYIWQKYLENIMPNNVVIEYGGSPIFKIYEYLGKENERFKAGDHDVASFTIYSDPSDLAANFSHSSIDKYIGDLNDAGLLNKQPVDRATTTDISGTMMRSMLMKGDSKRFKDMLPDPLDDKAREDIWRVLGGR